MTKHTVDPLLERASGAPRTSLIAEPPEHEMSFVLPFAPASQQSSSQRRGEQRNAVHAALARYAFILTGDLHVDVTWLVSERARYESDASADVDNILKPLLDAMCGPNGVLVDDCQLVSVSCGWLDCANDEQELSVRVRYSSDQWLRKDGLVFVDLGRALCFPFLLGGRRGPLRLLLDHIERALRTRATDEGVGIPPEVASLAMPSQRFFHRSKVTRFPVLSLDDVRRQLENTRD
jgi:Holliday junction resolvase RusA-like endonuclease